MKDKLIEKAKQYIAEKYYPVARSKNEALVLILEFINLIESELTPEPKPKFDERCEADDNFVKLYEPKSTDDKTVIGFDILKQNSDINFKQTIINIKSRQEPQMTAEEFLFNKYLLVSKEWFKDNDLTQEMIKMMSEYAEYTSQFQKPVPSDELRKELIKYSKSHYSKFGYIDEYLKQRKP